MTQTQMQQEYLKASEVHAGFFFLFLLIDRQTHFEVITTLSANPSGVNVSTFAAQFVFVASVHKTAAVFRLVVAPFLWSQLYFISCTFHYSATELKMRVFQCHFIPSSDTLRSESTAQSVLRLALHPSVVVLLCR